MAYIHTTPEQSELGKETQYDSHYSPEKLYPIPRKIRRDEIGLSERLPFIGFDIWNHYEVSWLNDKGKPIAAIAQIIYGCDSEYIIESKSMKLYFNSLNNTRFPDIETVQKTIAADLTAQLNGTFLHVTLIPLAKFKQQPLLAGLDGTYLDDLDIECTEYHTQVSYLKTEPLFVEEILQSDLLKSNCLVTNQPDWCSIQIAYKGLKINHEGLLRYLVSFRNDNEFHEQCIEKIFVHILQHCNPEELTVYGRSTRRGGLDINSYRSTQPMNPLDIPNVRLCRQ
jgi:7-cyano-7-deazaguanine reductase